MMNAAESHEDIRRDLQRGVMNMYQIYSLVGIVVLLRGITMWASIPEEKTDRR
jgi:hypothetical protein